MSNKNLTAAQRLEILRSLLNEIASGIRNAQEGLSDSENIANTAYLVACTLGRLGWMADRACVLAGDDRPPVVGDASAWLLSPAMPANLGMRRVSE